MEEILADVVVIGSGPSGQKAAIQASKLGASVVVVEQDLEPGGTCLYSGTIPSKSFREAVIDLTRFYERSFYGEDQPLHEVSIDELNSRLSQVIAEERNLIERQTQEK